MSAFKHPRKLLSASQGNVERLPNGNLFVGWGSQRWFTEFSPTGKVALRRPPRPRQRQLPRVPLPVDRHAGAAAQGRREQRGRQDHRLRELERRDQRRPLGAAGRRGRERARADRLRRRKAGFETAVTASRPQPLVAAARLRRGRQRADDAARRSSRTSGLTRCEQCPGGGRRDRAAHRRRAGRGGRSRPIPLPGTETASARTQISFRGVAPDAIGTVARDRLAQRPPRRTAARALRRQRRELRRRRGRSGRASG